eukprot:SM000093S24403  [mRNA]  locus=s93:132002:133216:+ [translate_table: standard]
MSIPAERLARLEAALATLGTGTQRRTGSSLRAAPDDVGCTTNVQAELQRPQVDAEQLQADLAEVVKEREKLMIENSKLQYRVMHLVRAVREKEAS